MEEQATIEVPADLPEAEARAIYAEHAELARDLCRGDGQTWANLPHSARDHYHAEAWKEIAEREGWQKKAQPDVDEDGNCVECGYELARCKCGTHPDPLGRPKHGDGFHRDEED